MHDIECSGEQQRQDLDRVAFIGADVLLDFDENPVVLRREVAEDARHLASLAARAR